MRTVRLMQYLYLGLLILFDVFFAVIFKSFGFTNINFISSMAFVGLLVFQQTDSPGELAVKVLIASFWLELNHVNSFPMFISVYLLTFLITGIVKQLIGTEIQEFYIVVILAMSLKELLMYIMLILFKGLHMSLLTFIVQRSFWVILGALLVIPIVISMNKSMHRKILQRAQNMYMR